MKNYIGKGKSAKYGIINFSICVSDIPKEEIKLASNGKKYLNLCIGEMKEPDKYGKTHTIWIDDFKPEPKAEPKMTTNEAGIEQEEPLPF